MDRKRPPMEGSQEKCLSEQNEWEWIDSFRALPNSGRCGKNRRPWKEFFWKLSLDSGSPPVGRSRMRLPQLQGDTGFNSSGAIPMNRLPLRRTIQPLLQFGKELNRFFLLAGSDQGQNLFLGIPRLIQKTTIHHTTPKRGPGLFCSRSSICHK